MSQPIADAAASPRDEEVAAAGATGVAGRVAFFVGVAGLLVATAADSIAVLGRHTGFALLGSIEIVQASIVFIAAASMVSVTLAQGHAAVHILTDRLSPPRKRALARIASLLGAITALMLAAGSLMLLADLWGGHERSELFHIPLRWLRLLTTIGLIFVAILFARQVFARHQPEPAHGA